MRKLKAECLNQVSGGGTQVFDDGSTLTTDEDGNVVSCTDINGNPFYAGGMGGMVGPNGSVLVPNGCTITGGSTTITQNPQVTTTTYAGGTSGVTISNAIQQPSTTTAQTINYSCPPNLR